ncbi:Stealth CR1 domain-containing protein [Notoacmeibacter ruber]|uniref:Nitrate reductase n=1 Tax=Notoacmeibacter ruber TaxID=2670375 RepID=A0A3L7J3U1_9HYPH|nr:Stealth CR1 domain-containing protein [Notoacmeibacter ruber]RLQ84995.1 nitrate reductase [Notoacmeibacter ruber]
MIDAVITWVDGSDPTHLEKRAVFHDPSAHPEATKETRFSNSGELRFCVLSLLCFCRSLRHIHVVTDGQYPWPISDILSSSSYEGQVRIVDHKEIFGEHADLLPVFSSRSIETMIHRIPGLHSKFIYLNDDIFIGRPVSETDFFEGDHPILRGTYTRIPSGFSRWLKSLRKPRPGYRLAQCEAARTVGNEARYFLLEHQPQPMRRETLSKYFSKQPSEVLRQQAAPRFRTIDQISPIGLACHLELAAGAPVCVPTDVGYIKPGRPTGSKLTQTMSELCSGGFFSFCAQSLDEMPDADREKVLAALNSYYKLESIV